MKTKKANFIGGRGVMDSNSGLTPKEHQGMGNYYGRAYRNPMGKMRSDTLGYIPISKKRLGTPPKSVVSLPLTIVSDTPAFSFSIPLSLLSLVGIQGLEISASCRFLSYFFFNRKFR